MTVTQASPPPSPVLAATDLVKRFNAVTAVDGISLTVGAGEILGLLGPNGAGKTTTIQMLLGIMKPTSGRITLFGLDLEHHRETILQQVNFSSTYVSLPYSLTVRENLMVFARLYGVKPLKTVVDEAIIQLDLNELADRPTKALSSGQLTRLHLAKALLNNPRLLFLDEPTASLDPDSADRIRSLLQQVRREQGTAMLITSHNMKEVESLCDRVIFLQQGRILAEGAPGDIIQRFAADDLEALFLMIARGQTGEPRP
ncbi:MAG: ABC transporter ATP-binding protein [Candidatus Sericytochromatia bacterium]|nr:ABC transporter ATP-binding protein [Candidatus Sericytochromatia bacterium]